MGFWGLIGIAIICFALVTCVIIVADTLKQLTVSRSNLHAFNRAANKRHQEQIAEFEKILEFQPDNANVLNNLAYLLADNNEQIEKAVEYAKRAYEAMPNDGNNLDTYALAMRMGMISD